MSNTHKNDGSNRSKPSDEFTADPLSGKIGAMLRESYQEVVEEGIPDDFLALLKQADSQKGANS